MRRVSRWKAGGRAVRLASMQQGWERKGSRHTWGEDKEPGSRCGRQAGRVSRLPEHSPWCEYGGADVKDGRLLALLATTIMLPVISAVSLGRWVKGRKR